MLAFEHFLRTFYDDVVPYRKEHSNIRECSFSCFLLENVQMTKYLCYPMLQEKLSVKIEHIKGSPDDFFNDKYIVYINSVYVGYTNSVEDAIALLKEKVQQNE